MKRIVSDGQGSNFHNVTFHPETALSLEASASRKSKNKKGERMVPLSNATSRPDTHGLGGPSHHAEAGGPISLPPLQSWMSHPAPSGTRPPHGQANPKRPASSHSEEVEAGLALAGMASHSGRAARASSVGPSASPERKRKAEKDGKDGKRSCAECRRLKAKCDRVFPCSNCKVSYRAGLMSKVDEGVVRSFVPMGT